MSTGTSSLYRDGSVGVLVVTPEADLAVLGAVDERRSLGGGNDGIAAFGFFESGTTWLTYNQRRSVFDQVRVDAGPSTIQSVDATEIIILERRLDHLTPPNEFTAFISHRKDNGVVVVAARFRYQEGPIFQEKVEYILEDRAFDHSLNILYPLADLYRERGSLALDTLAIDYAVPSMRLLYVWGYAPREAWRRLRVTLPPNVKSGQVFVELDRVIQRGQVVQLGDRLSTSMKFDKRTGWFECSIGDSDRGIEFAENTIAGLHGDELVAVWLRPEFG